MIDLYILVFNVMQNWIGPLSDYFLIVLTHLNIHTILNNFRTIYCNLILRIPTAWGTQ
jgi:hypothetical protein